MDHLSRIVLWKRLRPGADLAERVNATTYRFVTGKGCVLQPFHSMTFGTQLAAILPECTTGVFKCPHTGCLVVNDNAFDFVTEITLRVINFTGVPVVFEAGDPVVLMFVRDLFAYELSL